MPLSRARQALFGKHRICAVVAAPTAIEMLKQIRAAVKHTRTMELRLDWLRNKKDLNDLLFSLWSMRLPLTFLATCRRRMAGGKFTGSQLGELGWLRLAELAGSRWCDVEWETVRDQPRGFVKLALPKSKLLISLHDFRRVPRGLSGILRRIQARVPDAWKVAVECRSIGDSVRVLKLTRGRRNVVTVPMGEMGLPARVLALREGSALAYASVGPATAPGQLSLAEMKMLYRADRLDRRTKVYGVIGNPVGHSLSPLLFNTGFVKRGMNAVYLPFLVRNLRDFLAAIKPFGIAGFSVTLPHKQSILRHLDECDPLAANIGAVNTVVVHSGRLRGSNTDIDGILRPLECRMRIPGKRVLICGAGGAARAAAVALFQAGAAVCICSRRPERARAVARTVEGEAMARRHIGGQRFDIIINATPVGMHPRSSASPLNASELNCEIVFDLVYRPLKTKLLQLAARLGIKTIPGIEMFFAQGRCQWETWFGESAPGTAMRAAVLKALRNEKPRRPR